VAGVESFGVGERLKKDMRFERIGEDELELEFVVE
jgi:hypothetical protein